MCIIFVLAVFVFCLDKCDFFLWRRESDVVYCVYVEGGRVVEHTCFFTSYSRNQTHFATTTNHTQYFFLKTTLTREGLDQFAM